MTRSYEVEFRRRAEYVEYVTIQAGSLEEARAKAESVLKAREVDFGPEAVVEDESVEEIREESEEAE